MAIETPRINRWQQMQSKPVGSLATSMDAPSAAQTNYKQRVQDYSRAMRMLRQESRRAPTRMGRARAAMERIKLGEQAEQSGVTGVQGIRSAEGQRAAAQGYEATLGQGADAMTRANALASGALQLGPAVESAPRLGQGSGAGRPVYRDGRMVTDAQGRPVGDGGIQRQDFRFDPQDPESWPENYTPDDADGNGVPDMIQRPIEGIGASRQPRLQNQAAPSQSRSTLGQGTPTGGRDALAENRQLVRQREFLGKVRSGLKDRNGEISGEESDNLRLNAEQLGLDENKLMGFLDETIDQIESTPQDSTPKARVVPEVITNDASLDGQDAGEGKVYRYRKPGDMSEGISDRTRAMATLQTVEESRQAAEKEQRGRLGDLRLAQVERDGGVGALLKRGTDWSKVPRDKKIKLIQDEYGISRAEAARRLSQTEANLRKR